MKPIKPIIYLFLLSFVVGDCVTITEGILKGSILNVIEVTENNTYTLYDHKYPFTVTSVPEKYMKRSNKCIEVNK